MTTSRRHALRLLAVLWCIPLAAGAQRIPEGLLTRAERTDFVETSSYDEVVTLARALADMSDDVHMTTFGYTNEGRALPLVVVGAADASPEAVRETGKTRVYLQANIHAGEACGKEALLMLLRDYVTGPRPVWAEDLVLLIAPIYNADGNEQVDLGNRPLQNGPIGGMGQRPNAQGLDLNRDHMKLDSPEARSLVGLMNAYDPHVSVDLHTTNGSYHAYHLTYAPPLHPNTPEPIVAFLRERWLPEVTSTIRDRDGWEFYYYGNVNTGRPGWYTFDHRPRFNNNYVGLRNRMAILSEAYAYLTFEERVVATLRFVEEILAFAGQHASEIRSIVEDADADVVVGDVLTTRADFERSTEEVTILMGAVDEERHPYSGEVILRRRDEVTPTRMFEFGTFRATAEETVPTAYFILPSATEVIERLSAHGIRTELLRGGAPTRAEHFVIDSTATAARAFQGRVERMVWGEWQAGPVEWPAGTVRVPIDQPLGRLAFSLLEPRSDDGFVSWAFLEADVAAGTIPILREAPPARR